MAFTTYLADKLLDHFLKNTSYTPPTTVYLALFTTATTDAGGGTEVTGGSYARQPVTWNTAASKTTAASADVTFTNMPTATVTDGAIMDNVTGGNMLTHQVLVAPISTTLGDTVIFAAANVTETFS